MVKGLTAQELFIVFRLAGRPNTKLGMQILASLWQSCWLAHQQGGLFKVNEQNTLYPLCTFKMDHSMEL